MNDWEESVSFLIPIQVTLGCLDFRRDPELPNLPTVLWVVLCPRERRTGNTTKNTLFLPPEVLVGDTIVCGTLVHPGETGGVVERNPSVPVPISCTKPPQSLRRPNSTLQPSMDDGTQERQCKETVRVHSIF